MFDPSLPADSTRAMAAEMRAQFTALKALIDQQQNTINSLQAQINNLQAQLNSDTPHNCASVVDLSVGLSQPPTHWEVQPIIDKINELLAALRR